MTYTYYKVVANFEGEEDYLFGSYRRSDCQSEIECEKDSWREEGYRRIRIISKEVSEPPCPKVYDDDRETPEWAELFEELQELQNSGKHEHQDILTITGFMKTVEELEAHVERNR